MKRIIALIMAFLIAIPLIPVATAYGSTEIANFVIKDICCSNVNDFRAILEERGYLDKVKYYMVDEYLGTSNGKPKHYYVFQGHSDDSRPYFVKGYTHQLDRIYEVYAMSCWYESDNYKQTQFIVKDAVDEGVASVHSSDGEYVKTYSNAPIVKTYADGVKYMAGETFNEWGSYEKVGVDTVVEFDENAPYVSNAYIKYDYVVYDDGTRFDCDLHFTMPQIEDSTYKAYVCAIPSGKYNLVQMPMDNVIESRSFGIKSFGEVSYQYTTKEIVYSFSENVSIEDMINTEDYTALENKANFLQYVNCKVDKVTFVIYLSNGKTRGNYTRLSINTDGLKTTEILNGLSSNKEVAGGTVDIIDGTDTNVENVGNSTDIKDSTSIRVEDIKDVGTIVDYIGNGFGLVGDNGVIAMIGDALSFIPEPVIILLTTSFGVVCLVIVLKFIRG